MKNKTTAVVVVVVVAVIFFYGGMKYDQSKNSVAIQSYAARQGRFGAGGNGGGRGGAGGGITSGEVVSKDDKSLTLKTRDGSSKVIFFSPSTSVLKSASGSVQDLSSGTQVMVVGTSNQDGSISAQSIQVRPNIPQTQGQGQKQGQ